MTTRAEAVAAHGRIACSVLEVDAPCCANTYGSAPCTATGGPGSECHQTWWYCQDLANFVATTRTIKFITRGIAPPPGETLRPYIVAEDVAPTELMRGKDGATTRGRAKVTMTDEPARDDLDPYIANRITPAAGTYWRRLVARSPNLVGATARLKRGFVVSPWDWATFQTETYVIDAVKGPDKTGKVEIHLSDAVKVLDRSMIPATVDGRLAADFYAYSHVGTATGGGADYILLAPGASPVDDAYIGQEVLLTANVGAGQRRTITDYIGAERKAVVSAWSVVPDTTSAYEVSPLSVQVGSDEGAQYPDPVTSGKREVIRIKNEVIEYTAKSGDVLSWPSSAYRAQFGTVREYPGEENDNGIKQAAKAGDAVVLCRAWFDASPATVIEDILNDGGLADSNIDLTGLADECAVWLDIGAQITACIPGPEKSGDLFADLLIDLGLLPWWDAIAAKQRFKADRPEIGTTIESRGRELLWQSVDHERDDESRITRHTTRFDLVSPVAKRSEASEYLSHIKAVDLESEAQYGDTRPIERLSRWLTSANTVMARAQSQWAVMARKDAPGKYSARLDLRDEVAVGQLVYLTCDQVTDATGDPTPVLCRITRVRDAGTHQEIKAVSTVFGLRWAWFAPETAPVFASATDADKAYFYFCDDDGLMPDGSPGYRFI